MFEKHFGEIIVVERRRLGPVPIPQDNPNLHNVQFCLGGKTARAKNVRFNVKAFFADKSASRDSNKVREFLHNLRRECSTVYEPLNDTHCMEQNVAYYTLPSLVFELFPQFSISDIYTFWCCAELLASKAPHPQGSKLQRDAAKLRKLETGRYGKD